MADCFNRKATRHVVRANPGEKLGSLLRPSVASLNSLANVIRQAQPLYRAENTKSNPASVPTSKNANSLPLTVFEQKSVIVGGKLKR
jgi:hypothetical protein